MKLLTEAIAFAAEKHQGQRRKGTDTPYIVHPLEALSIAATLTNDPNVLLAAVLHDVVEDCDVSFDEISRRFGSEAARLVAADTEDKRENLSAESTWKIRKQETLNDIKKMDIKGKIVVLSDKLSNMRAIYRDFDKLGDDLWQRFNQKDKAEHYWYYNEIAFCISELKDHAAYKEYVELIDKTFR